MDREPSNFPSDLAKKKKNTQKKIRYQKLQQWHLLKTSVWMLLFAAVVSEVDGSFS